MPSRPYLQLGTSANVSYTFDPTRTEGDRVTSLWVDGAQVDPAASYKVAVPSFLASGGDNFRAFTEGTAVDTGLLDYEAWIAYLGEQSPVAPSYARHAVQVEGVQASYPTGSDLGVTLSALDLTSKGVPAATEATASIVAADGSRTDLGTFPVQGGSATISAALPAQASGSVTLEVAMAPSGTVARIPLQVEQAPPASGLQVTAEPVRWPRSATLSVTDPAGGAALLLVTYGRLPLALGFTRDGAATIKVPTWLLGPGQHQVTVSSVPLSGAAPQQATVTLAVTR